ncbi:ABC transporter permease [Globicatella sulfidifaciens]
MKKSFLYLLKYELKSNINNGYTFFFGALFPFILLLIISRSVTADVPEPYQKTVVTSIFLTMSMMVPLAIMFTGYAAAYANELEKNIPQRLNLFGIKQQTLFSVKLLAYYLFLTGCLIFYCCSLFFVDIERPTPLALITWLVVIYLFSAFLLALAHAIASLLKYFGPTYGVSMVIYFGIMILSGMMGITVDNLPSFLKPISKLLPTSQFGADFTDFWMGKTYNFAPLIQSMLFFGACSFIILFISFKQNKRKTRG